MMGGAPGPMTGGRENHPETVRVQSDRVTNYFCRHRKLILYGAIKILVMDRSFYPGIYKNVALLGQEVSTSVPGQNIA